MYLSGMGAFYLKNGQPTSSLKVGDTMGFNVPGYTQVWLDQYQNGQSQYSGPFTVPMAPYVLQPRDVGTFTASVFKLKANGTRGDNIGTDQITVAAADPVYASLTVNAVQAPGYTNPQTTPSGIALLPSGVATPSAPMPATIVMQPASGPIDFGAPVESGAETPAGQPGPLIGGGYLSLLAIGAGLYFLGRGRRK